MQELVIVKNIVFFKWNIRHTFFNYDRDVFWYHLKKKKTKVRNSTIYNKTYLDKSLTTLHLKKIEFMYVSSCKYFNYAAVSLSKLILDICI